MKFVLIVITLLVSPLLLLGQTSSLTISESHSEDLQLLTIEALVNNPEIQAASARMDIMAGKTRQAGTLDDPELRYMREEMPDFRWSQAMYSRLELMQMFRLPTKLFLESSLAEIKEEHAHHDHLEKINEVLAKLKSAYYELWFVQQNISLLRENIRLMRQFSKLSQTKYSVGEASQQDVLKAQVEVAKLENDLTTLRQKELTAKAMLMAILNRAPSDTIGFAVIPEEVSFSVSLDTLQTLAFQNRPMLKHDSLGIRESETMLSLAKQEYLPNFKVGLQYVTIPVSGFQGWSVMAGLTIPFAPWTLGKASGRVEEANASIRRSTAIYNATRNMVIASVQELYYKAEANKRQLDTYRTRILPQAQQSLEASITGYQTGQTDFLMLLDAYRTLVELKMEYFMIRMQYEQTMAELERAVGAHNIFYTK